MRRLPPRSPLFPYTTLFRSPRHRKGASNAFRLVEGIRLQELDENRPTQGVVRDIRRDAWTLHPNDVIGRVWLIRRDGSTVEAYTTTCPHLGCSINYEENSKRFICPCHMGTWDDHCKLIPSAVLGRENAAPRDMDALAIRTDPADPDLLQVKFENFVKGLPAKEPIK